MPTRSSYIPGTPSWVELHSPDPSASAAFYQGLLGWETSAVGDYTVFTLASKAVAGLRHGDTEQARWAACVCVADATSIAGVAREAGGRLVAEVAELPGVARVAVLADPEGTPVAVWEPRGYQGAELVNEPNTFCFTELRSDNPAEAAGFYQALFGWDAQSYPLPGGSYTEWDIDGRVVAGMVDTATGGSSPRATGWTVYFAVADCDAAAAAAERIGATVTIHPTDIPPGRHAVVRDPQGATLALIRLTHEAR